MNSAVLGYPFSFPAMNRPSVRVDWPFGAAVLASALIHGFALGWLPGLEGRMDPPEPPQSLHIRLAAPAPEPQALAVPPAPTFSAAATQPPARRAPAPQRSSPVLASPAREAGQDAPVLREVAPAPLVATPIAATPIDVPRPSPTAVPPPAIDAGALAAYGRDLAGAVATHQRYPRIALLRQWQGTAVLQLELGVDGRLLGVRVLSSSGHDTLDRQALDMVREAVPLPSLPAALAGRPLTVEVPVVFRITS
ncbi:MAG: TonB family protein [Pseudomonadota bacterium]